ncbi:MAG: hypothetical protein ACTHK1_07705 [Actinomycetales bacterium]
MSPTTARRDLGVALAVVVWIPAVLLVDRYLHGSGATLLQQQVLGLGTWVLLLALLWHESLLTRVQVGVVIAFATVIEYTFSPGLEVYVYRLHTVPAFVPPGHGLVYLAALTFGRSHWARRHERLLVTLTVVAVSGYALWGLFLSGRLDVLGAFWALCLLGFLRWGPSPTLYVGAFAVVTYLELLGTSLGSWTWQTHDPTGLVAIGNPPSGAAGGYGWFDLAALLAAPGLLRMLSVVTTRLGPSRQCRS